MQMLISIEVYYTFFIHNFLGKLFFMSGKIKDAIIDYSFSIKINPPNADNYAYRGRHYS